MKQTKIIPFDWEYYQANKDKCRVIAAHKNRGEIIQLHQFKCDHKNLYAGVIKNKYVMKFESNELYLEIEEYESKAYANIHRNKNTGKYSISCAFDSYEEANENIYHNENYEFIKTLHIHLESTN